MSYLQLSNILYPQIVFNWKSCCCEFQRPVVGSFQTMYKILFFSFTHKSITMVINNRILEAVGALCGNLRGRLTNEVGAPMTYFVYFIEYKFVSAHILVLNKPFVWAYFSQNIGCNQELLRKLNILVAQKQSFFSQIKIFLRQSARYVGTIMRCWRVELAPH